jgi:t-SNARE complex subunit (syntaxin)
VKLRKHNLENYWKGEYKIIMFEDLKNEKSKKDLQEKIEELSEVLKESRDFVISQQNEIDTLKHQFAESFQDAKRFSEHIDRIHKRIADEGLEQIFPNTRLKQEK